LKIKLVGIIFHHSKSNQDPKIDCEIYPQMMVRRKEWAYLLKREREKCGEGVGEKENEKE
jgi:hypothetical protein